MSRLPVPGNDDGVWGEVLNDFLLQSLDENGRIRPGVVADNALTPGARTALNKALSSVQSVNGITPVDGNVTIAPGAQGPQGTPGAAGPQGLQGPQGAAGATGSQGVAGTNGTNGTNGAQGPQGIAGENGVDGQSITVTFVAAEDWPPPSDPDPLHWYVKVS